MKKNDGANVAKSLVAGKKTYVMGILNVTPDSFSDGGIYFDRNRAIEHGLKLVEDGADIIDVGGIATSKYFSKNERVVDEHEELERVIPVIEGLSDEGIVNISIDTTRAFVAKSALHAGANIINDQSACLVDPCMVDVAKVASAIILMHNSGGNTSGVEEGEGVIYHDIVEDLLNFFEERINTLVAGGVAREKIIIDPGIGFGKGLKDSLTIIKNMHRFSVLDVMTLIGLSRKSFIGKMTGKDVPMDRDYASRAAEAVAIFCGAQIIRTHDVCMTVEMVNVLDQCIRHNVSGVEML